MKTESNLDKLNKIISSEPSNWLEEARWRAENEAWLEHSFKIAVRILSTLRSKSMTQKELAEKMGVSPQQVNKIVKGKENLSLETIAKLEKVLEIKLITVPTAQSITEVSYDYETAYKVSEELRKKMFAATLFGEYDATLRIDTYQSSNQAERQKIAA